MAPGGLPEEARRRIEMKNQRKSWSRVSLRVSLIVGGLLWTEGDVRAADLAAPQPPAIACTPASTPAAAPAPSSPRLELSYRQLSISNLDGTNLPLKGLELDMFPVSSRWVRTGLELEAGTGQARLGGQSLTAHYGLFGLTAGLQYPGLFSPRFVPFVEGRVMAGVLSGTVNGPVGIPDTTITLTGTSAVTWIYGEGLDVGADLFVLGRGHVSASVGWVRTTWGGVNYQAVAQNPAVNIHFN